MANTLSFGQKVQRSVGKFASLKGVIALKDGIVLTMPLTLVGSVFLLLQALPITGYADFMAGIFGAAWKEPLAQVSGATFDIVGLVGVLGIAYNYAKLEKRDPISCAILALANYLVLIPSSLITANGETVSKVIPKSWAGGQGMVGAILIGLCTAYIFCWCAKKNLKIKMPESVPEGVANAFSALIPGAITLTVSCLLFILVRVTSGVTLIEFIYKVLQIPLQGLSDSFIGAIFIGFLVPFFWFFGIHGSTLVAGIVNPFLMSNYLDNQALVDAGVTLIAGENAKIVTTQFRENFTIITGSGITIGLVVAALLFAKSTQYKNLGRLSLVPGIFNINEPVIFGFPVVLNPLLFIPFVSVPVLAAIITYVAIKIGFLAPFISIVVPWTTPPIISGFILGGLQGVVVQLIILATSVVVYYPFFKRVDKIAYELEMNAGPDEDDE